MRERANDWYNYCQLWMRSQRSLHSNCKHCREKAFFNWEPSDVTSNFGHFKKKKKNPAKIETFLPNWDDGGSRKRVSHTSINESHFNVAALVASGRRNGGIEGGERRWRGVTSQWTPWQRVKKERKGPLPRVTASHTALTPLPSGAFPPSRCERSSLFLWMSDQIMFDAS